MSRPPIDPEKTVAGITVDPHTLDRVIPESRRPDGSVRKQIKIRPGFTPQEDVRRFRGTKQAQMDVNVLPKGHIIGWAPLPTSSASANAGAKPLSKSAKKNAKRREKKEVEKDRIVLENWDDEDEGETNGKNGQGIEGAATGKQIPEQPNWAATTVSDSAKTVSQDKIKGKSFSGISTSTADKLVSGLSKLEVSS